MRSGIGICSTARSRSAIAATCSIASKKPTPPSTRRAGRRPAMIEREEVERLLWSCEHDPKAHLNMTAPALAALCRAWLALDGAPEGRLDIWQNDCDEQGAVEIVMDADAVR